MRNGPTALMKAVETGDPQMVELLLSCGADVNAKGWYGLTALQGAMERKDARIIRLLKRAGAK